MDKNKILECLYNTLDIDSTKKIKVKEDMSLFEIGMDSLKFISFIASIENMFSIEIRDSDLLIEKFRTITDIFNTLQLYLEAPLSGIIKKCLVLDCDNVLWHGIAGEEAITFSEKILELQVQLVELYKKGILLCLCSRNNEKFIWEAFSQPEMILKKEFIAAYRIGQQDKAKYMIDLSVEMNLHTDSFVFIDDSDYELGLISSLLPDVLCLNANSNTLITEIISIFSSVQPTEKINRTQLYHEQKEREKNRIRFQSVEEYNQSLKTCCICAIAECEQASRLAELSQRTHQCNFADHHYSKEQILAFLHDTNYTVISLSVSDRYGDMGIVGLAVVRDTIIEDFMLSCRVFSRGFEDILIKEIKKHVNKEPFGVFHLTDKNARYINFYPEHGVKIFS